MLFRRPLPLMIASFPECSPDNHTISSLLSLVYQFTCALQIFSSVIFLHTFVPTELLMMLWALFCRLIICLFIFSIELIGVFLVKFFWDLTKCMCLFIRCFMLLLSLPIRSKILLFKCMLNSVYIL